MLILNMSFVNNNNFDKTYRENRSQKYISKKGCAEIINDIIGPLLELYNKIIGYVGRSYAKLGRLRFLTLHRICSLHQNNFSVLNICNPEHNQVVVPDVP